MTVNDDLAISPPPFKVVAVIPVHERLELLPYTIGRLYKKNKVDRVICVGDGLKEKAICIEAGAMWVPYQNTPLAAKWNAGFLAAKTINPDAVIYSGSSDWLSDNWITIMKPYLNQHQMVGVPGSNLVDIDVKLRAVIWPGYDLSVRNETIGVGRMLSKTLLDRIDWKPFHDDKNNSLDRSMADKSLKVGVNDYFVMDESLKALSISTPKWDNKHKFKDHWNNLPPTIKTSLQPSIRINNPEEWCKINFPEALELHKVLYP